ncbi:MMPL family transporter [Phytohabitans sp. ZYX-F-186]|uniref:MMPL family transporter n=1 Tax=Phytohabitans maris TaxID=3071409 RepID=A0ABU0ZCK5_9ACTN|nr:MMPL family transporter [Phytohabitans sp. ZYX-F-186]MDQ7904800.1 MMPL family transporter [Phytohabitans sp. ZYX-F-186]
MSALLYRLGRLAYARPWRVIGLWLAVSVLVAGVLVLNPPQLTSEVRIEGTAAQDVIDELAVSMPEAAGGQGTLAFEAASGTTFHDPENVNALVAAVDAVYTADRVVDPRDLLAAEAAKGAGSHLAQAGAAIARVTPSTGAGPSPLTVQGQPVPGVLVAADGSAALLQFQFDAQTFELPGGTVAAVIDAARSAAEPVGMTVLPSAAMMEIPDVVGVGEVVGVAVAAVVLLVTLGSVVAAGLPLLLAVTGVALGVGGALCLSALFQMHSLGVVLALMLGLAVGIDYALFIVNRQRRLILDQNLTSGEAAARAVGTAGSAVVFAGSTVIVALLGLLLVRIELLTIMALVAAATVAIAVLLAVTLLPALLGLVEERICSPAARARHTVERHTVATRWSRWIVRHRWATLAVVVVVAGTVAVPAASMDLGLPSGASYNSDTPQRRSYDLVADRFGPGYNAPLLVVVHTTTPAQTLPTALAGVYQDLRGISGVSAISLAGTNQDGDTGLLTVVPATGPDDQQTKDLINALRAQSTQSHTRYGVDIGVTGFSALAIDVSDKLADVLPTYIGVILVLSLLILLLVFRSIVVPVKATAGFLLSVMATFGLTTAVFQWGWLQQLLGTDATTPVLSLLPIVITGVLYGLAMDYEMFLVTAMREAYVHGGHGRRAVVDGFRHASRVVVAAAVIMFSVFGGFVFNADPMIKQVGFALAAGILIDAFLVRLTLVPAIMALVGDKAWWIPRWLDRILPDLDVEGDKLAQQLATPPHTPLTTPATATDPLVAER